MKLMFFIFLGLTFIAFGMMRYHQIKFESRTGLKFNVMEFELPRTTERLNELIGEWADVEKKEFVLTQLQLDYFFMSTLFPTIFLLCVWARQKFQNFEQANSSSKRYKFLKNLLIGLAALQFFALIFDIIENMRLTAWINQGFVGNMFLFELLVRLKFLFAFSGFAIGLIVLIFFYFKSKKIKA